MSGVESVVAPHGVITEDTWIRENLVSLLGALYLYVWRAITWPRRDLVEKEYIKFRRDLASALNNARQTVVVKSTGTSTSTIISSSSGTPSKRKQPGSEAEEPSWKGWRTVTIKELDDAAIYVRRHGWLELDWAKGIDDLISQVLDGEAEEQEEDDPELVDGEENGDDLISQAPLHVRRPDTMLQDRYDYLSQRKLNEYEVWKKGILARIKQLEAAPASSVVGDASRSSRTDEAATAAARKAPMEEAGHDMDVDDDNSADRMELDMDALQR